MFWGVVVEAGRRYRQTVDRAFHISMGALEVSKEEKSSQVSIMLVCDKSEYLLATLQQGRIQQQQLDLNIAEGQDITFYLKGKGVVHLTGYMMDDFDYLEESSDDDEEMPTLVKAKQNAILNSQLGGKRKALDDADSKGKKGQNKVPKMEESSDSDGSDDEDDEEITSDEENETGLNLKELSARPDSDENSGSDDDSNSSGSYTPPNRGKGSAAQNQNASFKSTNEHQKTPHPKSDKKSQAMQKNVQQGESSKKSDKKKRKSSGGEKSAENAATPAKNGAKGTPGKSATPKTGGKPQQLAGGIVAVDRVVGSGPPATPGKFVHVFYRGTLKNGQEFDKCLGGKPFSFRLGANEVIKGWDIGLKGMKVGGKRTLTVPAKQAYGNQKVGGIPPNSSLTFDVELKAVT